MQARRCLQRSTFSDGRFKNEIREDVKGLDFIKGLRPVSYVVDAAALEQYYHQNDDPATAAHFPKSEWQQAALLQAATKRETGFIAQEVANLMKETGYSFSGVDVPIDARALYGIRYADFVVPLVKAMQEQQLQIEALQKENAQLKAMKADIEMLKVALLNKN